MGVPFNISALAEANDFKISMRLEVAKAHNKIPPRRKSVCPGLGELPKIWGFPCNISAMTEASDFKIGTQLGFAKAHNEIPPGRKSVRGRGLRELPNIFGVPLSYIRNG